MSNPFDATTRWWTSELRQIAQIVHQAHTSQGKTWQVCPMASCKRIRDVIAASEEPVDIIDISPEDIILVRLRKKRS